MTDSLRLTDDTVVEFTGTEIQDVHLGDLSFVLDIESDDGEVTYCEIDLPELIQAMTLYSSMEGFRYDWR